MKTLEEHNQERQNLFFKMNSNEQINNGIACPKCGLELFDSQPNVTLASMPPQKNVACKCGYTGYRVA